MSWNHTQEYDNSGTYQDYATRLGGGQYEKVWDLGTGPPLPFPICAEGGLISCRGPMRFFLSLPPT